MDGPQLAIADDAPAAPSPPREASPFAGRLRALREQQGVTLEVVAAQIGTTKQSMSHWELGRSEPSFEMLVRLARHYRVSIDWLVGGETRAPPRK